MVVKVWKAVSWDENIREEIDKPEKSESPYAPVYINWHTCLTDIIPNPPWATCRERRSRCQWDIKWRGASTSLEQLPTERVVESCQFVSVSLMSMNERDLKVVKPTSMQCKIDMG